VAGSALTGGSTAGTVGGAAAGGIIGHELSEPHATAPAPHAHYQAPPAQYVPPAGYSYYGPPPPAPRTYIHRYDVY
jgi:hypothetical protein